MTKRSGRPLEGLTTIESLERMIADAIDLGCKRIDLFFMTGLPKQTYSIGPGDGRLLPLPPGAISPYNKLIPFISPLAPFLDPGSSVFRRTGEIWVPSSLPDGGRAPPGLAGSRAGSISSTMRPNGWTRDDIVYSTYEAGKRLNRLKAEFGLIDPKTAESVERRIDKAVQMMKEIDRIMALPDPERERLALEA